MTLTTLWLSWRNYCSNFSNVSIPLACTHLLLLRGYTLLFRPSSSLPFFLYKNLSHVSTAASLIPELKVYTFGPKLVHGRRDVNGDYCGLHDACPRSSDFDISFRTTIKKINHRSELSSIFWPMVWGIKISITQDRNNIDLDWQRQYKKPWLRWSDSCMTSCCKQHMISESSFWGWRGCWRTCRGCSKCPRYIEYTPNGRYLTTIQHYCSYIPTYTYEIPTWWCDLMHIHTYIYICTSCWRLCSPYRTAALNKLEWMENIVSN